MRIVLQWIKSWIAGGEDELGWDDVLHRVIKAVGKSTRYGARGSVSFPPELEVHIAVAEGSVDVVRSFVDTPEFDQRVESELVNQFRCEAHALPIRSYFVEPGPQTSFTARECEQQRVWHWTVSGGDLDGTKLSLPKGRGELRFGRGPWHGNDNQLANDLVVCNASEFVSRRAGRLLRQGGLFEIEALDQGDCLIVQRQSGERQRPARTGRGRLVLREGDRVQLSDGKAESIELVLDWERPA